MHHLLMWESILLRRTITRRGTPNLGTYLALVFSFAQIEKSIARKETKYNHLERISVNRGEIKNFGF